VAILSTACQEIAGVKRHSDNSLAHFFIALLIGAVTVALAAVAVAVS
jgi:hypothetical protein